MTRLAALLVASILFSSPLLLGPRAAEAAQSMGLPGEQAMKLTGTVVDLLSELTGKPAADCGGGKHQLGVKTGDGGLYLVAKDVGDFTGAVPDLLPYCGKTVTLDGLLASQFGVTFYVVQTVQAEGGKPACADQTLTDWAKAHNVTLKAHCSDQSEWYRKDERVAKIIAEHGKLGTGK